MAKKPTAKPTAEQLATKSYEVLSPIRHDGDDYEIGSQIELDDIAAASLSAADAIAPVETSAEQ